MKTRWGILSTAKIGLEKVIPAIQNTNNCKVVAIASRQLEKAYDAAEKLNIERTHGSYESLLNDNEVDIIYNPLPNHLHVPFTIKALEAGKHVLCEKPIGLNTAEAVALLEETSKYPHLKVMEAFMYRFHPQWIKVKEAIAEGEIGAVKTIQMFFSYFNADPQNIRNQFDIGGGALMDIGCYCVSIPRFVFDAEPKRVMALIDRDPEMKTDRLTSGMLDFGNGISSAFTCSTQLNPFQRVQILGEKGRIEVGIPVNASAVGTTNINVFGVSGEKSYSFNNIDQYTQQAEAFSKAVIDNTDVPTPLTDAVNNMMVIDALLESEAQGKWASV
ncbi:MAG: Gfo/Idh/MocA family oxidoreductase [Prolixibacteraceae bacterium]|jgi:predicted dehydrogenase|nr:Gfo/Idh/MocA family oxidoreductase [Prolixibacteraceae bacterium]